MHLTREKHNTKRVSFSAHRVGPCRDGTRQVLGEDVSDARTPTMTSDAHACALRIKSRATTRCRNSVQRSGLERCCQLETLVCVCYI